MSARSNIDQLFMTLIERQGSVFETIGATNERYHRFARSLIEGLRQGSHDWTNVVRGWTERPTDVVGLYESASEAIANDQARRLALWQEFLDDLAESQREGREVMRGSLGRMREAVDRVQESVPSYVRDRVSALRRDETEPVAQA